MLLALLGADAPEPPQSTRITDPVPYGQQPVDYLGTSTDDAVAKLRDRIAAGEQTLAYDARFGWLPALLQALDVPVESQLLVFSKTSVNTRLISPSRPRAVYFNDEVSIGWVPGAETLEITAVDPRKGAIFYLLPQSGDRQPSFRRDNNCLACHAGSSTLHVPGWMVRSFLTDDKGQPVRGYSRVTHATELAKRWGGWYVTGEHSRPHLGNLIGEEAASRHEREPAFGGNAADLGAHFDATDYPSPHSDLVAHLVLDHQAHGLNLIARVGMEARLDRRSGAEEQLVRYLLFAGEAPLGGQVRGTSGFAEWFEQQGPRDAQGRSLRQLELTDRLLRYRLSWLIDSRAFQGLPADVLDRLRRRIVAVLRGEDDSPEFSHLTSGERSALLEILHDTRPEWRAIGE